MPEMEKTITLTPEIWAKKTAKAMEKIMDEAKELDAHKVNLLTLHFLAIQGVIFNELFNEEEEEVANA